MFTPISVVITQSKKKQVKTKNVSADPQTSLAIAIE